MKLKKNYEILKKEINQELRKFLGNFTLNFWKVYTKLIEFQNFKIQMKLCGEIGRMLFSKFYFFSDKLFRLSFCNLLYGNCTFTHYIRVNNILES